MTEHSPRTRGTALLRYFASVFIAMIVIGLKLAADHWPCEFRTKGTCSLHH